MRRAALQDLAAQSRLRTALTAVKVYWTDELELPADAAALESVEDFDPGLPIADGDLPGQAGTVSICRDGERVLLSTRSESGFGWYLAFDLTASYGYAVDAACGPAAAQRYELDWPATGGRWRRLLVRH